MNQYYTDTLSAQKLERCYEIAPPRIRQYFKAEIKFVIESISRADTVLELGCGYGRVLNRLLDSASHVFGVDTSLGSLQYGRTKKPESASIQLAQMDAGSTAFQDESFDAVVCIQNGVSAFKVDPIVLVKESLRITARGGKCFFSTYSDKIWEDRLYWFRLQAEEKLLGDIDWNKTERGTIVCKDGFVAKTYSEEDFLKIARRLGVSCEVTEVDSSSLFGIFSPS
ncbi:MAG: class I SAM-dependent methyltransferase [Candidatus Thorarchaeota archaeon]|jgi:2-polyprenyl-6-hydroxyphenyl methylase/3-demethylubiquinone-9 3-methyltransferase